MNFGFLCRAHFGCFPARRRGCRQLESFRMDDFDDFRVFLRFLHFFFLSCWPVCLSTCLSSLFDFLRVIPWDHIFRDVLTQLGSTHSLLELFEERQDFQFFIRVVVAERKQFFFQRFFILVERRICGIVENFRECMTFGVVV